ncbi:hypothetical protein Fmac_026871 [Flemingia macrophylla]|uniref:Uncharacterized protein n=1 Tax=Flemingia macrophylla TaxID=520843 RepID=A0ABD1LG50_9FABA
MAGSLRNGTSARVASVFDFWAVGVGDCPSTDAFTLLLSRGRVVWRLSSA